MNTAKWLMIGSLIWVLAIAWMLRVPIAFMMFPLKGMTTMKYPDSVDLIALEGEDYSRVMWPGDNSPNPKPYPLTIRIADKSYDGAFLSDSKQLRLAGWTSAPQGQDTEWEDKDKIITCRFQNEQFFYLSIDVSSDRVKTLPPVFVVLGGKELLFPATEEAVIQTFGPPISKH